MEARGSGSKGNGGSSPPPPLTRSPPSSPDRVLKLTFPGSNPDVRIEPFDPLTTTVSYFIGNDPVQWRAGVPVWGGVRYADLYPGVDLVIGGIARRLADGGRARCCHRSGPPTDHGRGRGWERRPPLQLEADDEPMSITLPAVPFRTKFRTLLARASRSC